MANKSKVKLLTLSRRAATKALPSDSLDFRLESVALSAATEEVTLARRQVH